MQDLTAPLLNMFQLMILVPVCYTVYYMLDILFLFLKCWFRHKTCDNSSRCLASSVKIETKMECMALKSSFFMVELDIICTFSMHDMALQMNSDAGQQSLQSCINPLPVDFILVVNLIPVTALRMGLPCLLSRIYCLYNVKTQCNSTWLSQNF